MMPCLPYNELCIVQACSIEMAGYGFTGIGDFPVFRSQLCPCPKGQ